MVFIDADTGKIAQPLLDDPRRARPRALRGQTPTGPTGSGPRVTPFPGAPQRGAAEPGRRDRRVLLVLQERVRAGLLRRARRDDDHGQQRPAHQLPQRELERHHHQLLQRRHVRRRGGPRVGPRLHRVHLGRHLPVAAGRAERVLLRRLGRDRRPDQRPPGRGRGRHRHAARRSASARSTPAAPSTWSSTRPRRHRRTCDGGAGRVRAGRSTQTGVTDDVVVGDRRRRAAGGTTRRLHAARQRARPSPASSPTSTAAPAPSRSRSNNAEAAGAIGIVVGNNVAGRAADPDVGHGPTSTAVDGSTQDDGDAHQDGRPATGQRHHARTSSTAPEDDSYRWLIGEDSLGLRRCDPRHVDARPATATRAR